MDPRGLNEKGNNVCLIILKEVLLSPITLLQSIYKRSLSNHNMKIKAQLKIKSMSFLMSVSINPSFIPTRLDSKSGIMLGDIPIFQNVSPLKQDDCLRLDTRMGYTMSSIYSSLQAIYMPSSEGIMTFWDEDLRRDSQYGEGSLFEEHEHLFCAREQFIIVYKLHYSKTRLYKVFFPKHSSNM